MSTDIGHLLEVINMVGTTNILNIKVLTQTSLYKIKKQVRLNMPYITVCGNDYFSSNINCCTELLLL